MSIQAPNYTQTPNEIFELMPLMDEAELRVTLAIVRETFGWHRKQSKLSLSRLMKLTGLSRQGVINGIEAGMNRRTLGREPEGDSFRYFLVVETAEVVNSVDQGSQLSRPGVVNSVDTYKESVKEKEPSVPAALNTPRLTLAAQFRSLVDELKTSTNKSAVLRNIYILCYGEETAPTYSYIGGVAKKIGGAGYLAQRLWELSARPPTGDVLAYLLAEHQGKQTHRKYDSSAKEVNLDKLLEGATT